MAHTDPEMALSVSLGSYCICLLPFGVCVCVCTLTRYLPADPQIIYACLFTQSPTGVHYDDD